MAIRPPRDWARIKDRIVGFMLGLTGFNTLVQRRDGVRFVPSITFVWFFFCMFLAFGVFAVLGVRDYAHMEKYFSWWIGLTVLFFLMPEIVFRGILRYQDIPKNWTYNVFRHWLGVGEGDPLNRHRKWIILLLIGIIIVNVIAGVVTSNPTTLISLLGSLGIVVMFLKGYQNYWWSRRH